MSDYTHQEYPKWIKPEGYEPFIVNTKEEEDQFFPAKTAPEKRKKEAE
jgi:hypothetical protein